ncbi:MAG: AAA family ATPase [Saprospiraceae bacterium]|nr:AAA family ATPase [Saprospiraceae bacterium]MCP5299050.1 AAA family ATPase [Chromatiaceae bacterium]
MTAQSLFLRHLVFTGSRKEPAGIEFAHGLNVIYGASETGKSFLLEALDFMLGSSTGLRDIPERVGYDTVFLGMEDSNGQTFTLERSTTGGAYRCYEGLYQSRPEQIAVRTLGQKHNPTNHDNLSMFLLEKIGLDGKRVQKNKGGDTNTLSFRNLAHLCLVGEGDIQKQGSPFETGQFMYRTVELSTLKLLLSGSDDSSLQPTARDAKESGSRTAKIEIIDELIAEFTDRLSGLVGEENNEAELTDQLAKLRKSLQQEEASVRQTENDYRAVVEERNQLRRDLEGASERRGEISELLARFELLERHYLSDLLRLEGIQEAGILVSALSTEPCPLCGATPDTQHLDGECDGNVDAVIAAASAEREKIVQLLRELRETVEQLQREAHAFDAGIPDIRRKLEDAEKRRVEMTPSLTKVRTSYSDLTRKATTVQDALNILKSISELETRKTNLESTKGAQGTEDTTKVDVSFSTLDKFSSVLETILKDWHFPGADRVFFDKDSRDFIIAGKPRGSRGKGLRAITHAAFTTALVEFTRTQNLPHPGFIVLDTPLLAYREPEGDEDDLTGTDVKERFFDYLAERSDRQYIILENVDVPANIEQRSRITFFSKNPHSGRYGFFPE